MADWIEKYHDPADFITEGVSMGCRVVGVDFGQKPDEVALVDFEYALNPDGTFAYVTMVPKKEEGDG